MKQFLILFTGAFFILIGFARANTLHSIDSIPGKILIVNAFDAKEMKNREKVKDLFARLAEDVQQDLAIELGSTYGIKTQIQPGVLVNNNPDSMMHSLIAAEQATKGILITNMNVFFKQTGVEVTGTKGDKTRVASYDICADITYVFYIRLGKFSESPTHSCEYHSKRNVISGLLAMGPDLVKKRRDAARIIRQNTHEYMNMIDHEMMAN